MVSWRGGGGQGPRAWESGGQRSRAHDTGIAMLPKQVNWNRFKNEVNIAKLLRSVDAIKATATNIASAIAKPTAAPSTEPRPVFKRGNIGVWLVALMGDYHR